MFNFQKEVVLNSFNKVAVVNPGGDGKDGAPNIDKKLRFHDGGEYFAKYIVDGKIYRTLPIDGEPAKITLDASKLATIPSDPGHIQIRIELGLDNNYRGDWGSALYYFRKPVIVDVNTDGLNADKLAKAFKTAIPTDYTFLKVYVAGDEMPDGVTAPGANEVLLVSEDSYIKVRSLIVETYECANRCEGQSEEPKLAAEMTKEEDSNHNLLIKGGNEQYGKVAKNNVEYGTYEYLLHNLRLPTYENLRFTSPSAPEMPVKGVAYAQYSFAYCVPRGIHFGGMSVAGQTNHSTTLHTFFVPVQKNSDTGKYEENSEFEKLFKDPTEGLGMSDPFIELGRDGKHKVTILADQFASTQDLANTSQVEKNKAAIKKAHPDTEV